MKDTILTKTGKLHERFLPAIYFDTSVLIDYWMTEGMEMPESERDELLKKNELPYVPVIRNILRSERRISKVVEIRKKLIFEKVKVTPVVSPLSLLELTEWHAEAAFKQIASEASGVIFIQRKSKKQIGKKRGQSTGLEMLMSETWLNPSFAIAHGLQGLLQVDIVNFHLSVSKAWEEPSDYAYLQLGIADIMHILLAQHLGCQYIASFDSDFARVKDIITEETGMTTLTKPEEILDIF